MDKAMTTRTHLDLLISNGIEMLAAGSLVRAPRCEPNGISVQYSTDGGATWLPGTIEGEDISGFYRYCV